MKMLFDPSHFFQSASRKTPSSTRLRLSCKSQSLLHRKEPCEQPMKGRMKWEGVVGGELWAGTDNQSGCPGDTNFSVRHPHPALPHQSLFRPDRADQWPRVMVVSSFVWLYSTAHHCDGSTRPEWDRKRKARLHSAAQNVLLGGHVAV